MTTTSRITAEEFGQMTFDSPVELVRGEVVEMNRPGGVHGVVCFNVAQLLGRWRGDAENHLVLTNDAGVITAHHPDTVRGPDVFVIARSRLPEGRIPPGYLDVAPELIVEVVSSSDRWSDVIAKVADYLQVGVQEAWIVDPEQKRIHVYTGDAEPHVFDASAEVSSRALPGLQFHVNDLFRGV
ncbi:MAG: Uma2 family endonuclease [Maioricimonas sp. JB049]